MKTRHSQPELFFSRNIQSKKAPYWLLQVFLFSTENGDEQFKKTSCKSLSKGSGLGNFVFVDDLFQIEVLTWFTKCGQIELSGGFGKFGPKF